MPAVGRIGRAPILSPSHSIGEWLLLQAIECQQGNNGGAMAFRCRGESYELAVGRPVERRASRWRRTQLAFRTAERADEVNRVLLRPIPRKSKIAAIGGPHRTPIA